MNRKHYDMVDAWVKKHYGDLERGVLSEEVRYKILFRIYRKKYKKEKALRKHLEETVKDWCFQNKALELPEDLDRKLFPWHLAPSPDKVLPKDDGFNSLADGFKRYLRETCEECRYYKKGEDGEKDVCTKHDKFVTSTCTCFEWERKNCTLCKHSRMLSALNYEGAYTSCLWCDKKNEKRSALDEVCEDFE